jgi:hypothetical protein
MIAPGLMPRTIQLCTRCQQNPAGFWVSSSSGQTVRRPWCLACLPELDRGSCHVIPLDSVPRTGPHRRAPHGGTARPSHRAPGQPGRRFVRGLRTLLTGCILILPGAPSADLLPPGPWPQTRHGTRSNRDRCDRPGTRIPGCRPCDAGQQGRPAGMGCAALTAACPVGVGRGDEPPPPSPWPGTEGEHHHDGGSSNRGAPRRDQVKALVPGWGVPARHRCRT